MLVRSCTRCLARPPRRIASPRPPFGSYARVPCRTYGTPAGGSTAPAPGHGMSLLAPLVNELDRMAPSFDLRGEQIRILKTPTDFYETLKDRIRNAKRHIFLSTLYIGKTESELVETLRDALRRNPELTLSILTDALRGTREAPAASSASLLAPLVIEFGPERVEIRMYHTPNLTGLRKKYIPKRINEGWGLQHMKLYGVDDEIILSGANLSSDYFTNRQDRYHLFSSAEVTNYFRRIHDGASSFSFLVQPSQDPAGFTLTWPQTNSAPSPLDNPRAFIKSTTSTLQALIAAPSTPPSAELADTRVYMLAQMSQVMKPDTSTELPVITHILSRLASPSFAGSSWTFTAGYFNPAPSLTKLLLNTASTNNTVITAAPQANGFYGSSGVSGLLPDAYTLLARRFLHAAHQHHRTDITLREWRQGTVGQPNGWTYHAKGLWVSLPHDGPTRASLSVIGSSNYTRRSYSLDLEAGALVVTRDEGLRARLGEERAWLSEHAGVVTRDDFARVERRVGLKVRIAMWIVQLVGGQL